jgi:hypothetical protein
MVGLQKNSRKLTNLWGRRGGGRLESWKVRKLEGWLRPEYKTGSGIQPSNLPTFQPSNFLTFQPSNFPVVLQILTVAHHP